MYFVLQGIVGFVCTGVGLHVCLTNSGGVVLFVGFVLRGFGWAWVKLAWICSFVR